jgi:aminoglycoside 2''-phosphotransferase
VIESLPPLTWLEGVEPHVGSAEELGEGDSCLCYLVNGRNVLRIAKHPDASRALERERLLLPRLAATVTVPLPDIRAWGVRADSGDQFVYYPLLEGAQLTGDAFKALPAGDRLEILGQIASLMNQLHRFPVEEARACGVPEMDPRQFLPAMMAEAERAITTHAGPDVWRYHIALLNRYLGSPQLLTYEPSLVHGDFAPEHLLFATAPPCLTGVLDFGDCMITDPLRDLIFLLEDYDQETFDSFLTLYAPKGERQAIRRRVTIFQQLDNVEHCLSMLRGGDDEEFAEALAKLVARAGDSHPAAL